MPERRRLCIFSHVEKCGGTSLIALSRRRASLAHCDLIHRDANQNSADAQDFTLALRAYPRLDFISGHGIAPTRMEEYRAVAKARGYDLILAVTTLRSPLERALSDYVHDVTRRGSQLTFEDFIALPWKQNYLTRFFGDGDLENAKDVLSGFDCIDTSGGGAVRALLSVRGFEIPVSDKVRTNVFDQAPPPCLRVIDGVRVGKFQISQKNHENFTRLNADDIVLFDWASTLTPKTTSAENSPTIQYKETRSRPLKQRLFRNLIYKPFFALRIGFTVLPRNAVSAEKVHFATNSIWSERAEATNLRP